MALYDNAKNTNSTYVPTFVGSTYNELANAGKVLDERYRTNKDYADKVAIMAAQDQLLEGDQSIKDAYVNKANEAIKTIGKSDANFENSSGVVSQLAKDIYTDPVRLRAIDNARKAEQAKALSLQYGEDALNFGDNPNKFSTVNQETGQLNRFNVGVEKRADYSKKMQDLLGRVASDGYSIDPSGSKITYNDYERYLIKSGQVNKLSPEKLHGLVDNLIPSYKASGEGTQDLRRLQQIEGLKQDGITVPIYGAKGKVVGRRQTNPIDEDIRNRFYAIAAPQAFQQSQQRWDDFGLPVTSTKVDPTEGQYTPTNPGSVTDNTSLNPIPTEQSDEYTHTLNGKTYQYLDDKGQPVKNTDIKIPHSFGTAGADAKALDEAAAKYKRVEIDPKLVNAQIENSYQKALGVVPANTYKGVEDYKASYQEAVKNQAKITPTGNVIAPAQAEQYDDLINRASVSTPFYFKEGSTPVTGIEGLAKQIGTSPSNIKLKAVNTYYDSPRKDLPGGYVEAKIEVNDAKVKNHPASVFVPLNDQFVGLSSTIDHLYKASFYQGQDSYTINKPYFPEVGGQPMQNAQGRLGFYTTTYPIPKDQQVPGKPGFKTVVHSIIAQPNNSGGYDMVPYSADQSIGQWKQQMVQSLSPLLKNALNSGQTFNTEDAKKRGIDY